MKSIIAILRCFEAVLGLKVNLFKSALIGIPVDADHIAQLAEIMGCKVESLSTSYLGLPLSMGCLSTSLWNPVVERIDKKLSAWKARFLSVGGRITLI